MSKYDPLNLMGNPNEPNRWLHMVPKVHRFQCEICRWPASSYRVLKEHQFLLHEFPLNRPIIPIPNRPSTSPGNATSAPNVNSPSVKTSSNQPSVNSNLNQNISNTFNNKPDQPAKTTSNISKVNPMDVWKNKCHKCGACFTRNNSIKRHLKKSCPMNKYSKYRKKKKTAGFKCYECGKMYSTKTNLNQHKRNKHQSKPL